jgi:hypothetical protein
MKTTLLIGAMVLGCTFAAATTANAAPPPPPNFGFGIQIGPGGPPPPPPPRFNNDDDDNDCLSNREIFRQLGGQGYSGFTNLDDSDDDTLTVDARRGSRWYELDVDSCSGDIVDRTRIRPPR